VLNFQIARSYGTFIPVPSLVELAGGRLDSLDAGLTFFRREIETNC
jgi:hypothetical protein